MNKWKSDDYTKMALTNDTSNMVGTTLKTKAARMKLMPRLPRSIACEMIPFNNLTNHNDDNKNESVLTLERAPV